MNYTQLKQVCETQKRIITALQHETHWLLDTIYNPSLNDTDMRLLVETTPYAVRAGLISIEDAPERKIYYPTLAAHANCSDKTASQRLRKLAEKAGVFTYRRAYDVDEQGNQSENPRVFIKPTTLAETPAQIDLARGKPGGSTWEDGRRVKRCKDCGSANLERVSQIICRDCGTAQTEKSYKPVNSHYDTGVSDEDDQAHDESDQVNSHYDTDESEPISHYDTGVSEDDEISNVPTSTVDTLVEEEEESLSHYDGGVFADEEQEKESISHYDTDPPAFLKNKDIWCCGRKVWNEERQKFDKIPYIADMLGTKKASSTDPSTWRSHGCALTVLEKSQSWKNPFDFLMFMCDGTLTFLDQDHCGNTETGEFTQESLDRARRINSYTEISWSGDGLHTYASGALPPGRRRMEGIEMYDRARPCVYTGRPVPGFPLTVEHRPEEIAALHAEIFPPQPETLWSFPASDGAEKSDQEIEQVLIDTLQRISKAENGAKIMQLWNGDYSAYTHRDGSPDHSRGDAALCTMLAFYVGKDVSTVDKLFRHSKLYRPKWERADYRERTLRYALGSEVA